MNTQPEFNFTGTQLRDAGMKLASESAEQDSWGWNETAYQLLTEFVKTKNYYDEWMCEEFREFAMEKGLPEPPSKRAFGSVIIKAAKNNLVQKIGYGITTNPKCHATPATLWAKTFKEI